MCPPGYHHTGCMATHKLGYARFASCHTASMVITGREHWLRSLDIILVLRSSFVEHSVYVMNHIHPLKRRINK